MGGGGIRPHRRQRARRFQQEDRAEVPSLGCGEEHGRQVAAYTERDIYVSITLPDRARGPPHLRLRLRPEYSLLPPEQQLKGRRMRGRSRGEVPRLGLFAGGGADDRDPARVDAVSHSVARQPAHRRSHVVHGRREGFEPVVDRGDRVPALAPRPQPCRQPDAAACMWRAVTRQCRPLRTRERFGRSRRAGKHRRG